MKIEILYFSGCPNHPTAVDRVREALREEGLRADMAEIEVNDEVTARRMRFLGSPTIRVDGQDIEVAARSEEGYRFSCRTYTDQGHSTGVPPLTLIRTALRERK